VHPRRASLAVVLALSACGAGATRPPSGGPAAIGIRDYAFAPSSLTVPAGTAVTWTEHDADIAGVGAHSVVADGGAFRSADHLANGAAFTFTPPGPGTYAYHCGIHNYMTGTITVR
jgi:plastocyanin